MNLFQKATQKLLGYVGLLPANRTLTGLNIYPTNVGRTITEESSLGIAAVWSCVRLLSEVGGNLPLHFLQEHPDGSSERIKYKLDYVVTQEPNAWMTSNEFWEAQILALATWGNSYAVIERNAVGDVIAMVPIKPDRVTVQTWTGQITYRIATNTGYIDYQPHDIFHTKLFSFDGLVGLSPIGTCRQALGLAVAAEEYGARFYSNNAIPAGFVSPDVALKQEQVDAFKIRLNSNNQGLDKSHQIDILPVGFKWQQITIPPEDSQFIESRKFSKEEIASIFRVPPHLIGDLQNANFSNVESQNLSFLSFSLLPYLSKIEAAIVRALVEQKDKGIIKARFDADGLLRADSVARSEYYSKMIASGVMSPNEVRAKEGLKPYTGGDSHFLQVNMSTVEKIVNGLAPQITSNK